MKCPYPNCSTLKGSIFLPFDQKITINFFSWSSCSTETTVPKISKVFFNTSSKGQQFMQCFCFFQQPYSTKPCSMKGSCRSANGSSSCAGPQELFLLFTFSPKEYTISYMWLFLQELCPREARDISEFVLFKLQSPLCLCEVVDYSLKQNWADAKPYPRVKSTL